MGMAAKDHESYRQKLSLSYASSYNEKVENGSKRLQEGYMGTIFQLCSIERLLPALL